MKKITIMIVIMTLMSILPILASDFQSFGTYRLNDIARLQQGCIDSTYSNITSVQYPNGTPIILNQANMTNFTKDFYYYDFAKTDLLGYYRVYGICDEYTIKTLWAATFLVTPNGYSIDTPKSIMVFVGLGILIFIGLVLFIFGMSSKMMGIKIFTIGLSVLIILLSLSYALITVNYTLGEFTGLSTSLHAIYIVATVLLVCGGIGLLLFLIAFAFNAFYKSRGMRD